MGYSTLRRVSFVFFPQVFLITFLLFFFVTVFYIFWGFCLGFLRISVVCFCLNGFLSVFLLFPEVLR